MWFVSTPSLVISVVLAVFYVANLVFYAVNRHQEQGTDNIVEITSAHWDNELRLQQAVLLNASQNTFDKFEYSYSADYSLSTQILNSQFSILNYFFRSLPDITFSVFDSGICWQLFSRPPPMG